MLKVTVECNFCENKHSGIEIKDEDTIKNFFRTSKWGKFDLTTHACERCNAIATKIDNYKLKQDTSTKKIPTYKQPPKEKQRSTLDFVPGEAIESVEVYRCRFFGKEITEGRQSGEICKKYFISPQYFDVAISTESTHFRKIYGKLNYHENNNHKGAMEELRNKYNGSIPSRSINYMSISPSDYKAKIKDQELEELAKSK